MENTIKFLGVLGVEVVEVESLDGKCAVWSESKRALTLCESLCGRQKAEYLNQVLEQLGRQ